MDLQSLRDAILIDRKKKGFTVCQLAKELGISRQYLSDVLNGKYQTATALSYLNKVNDILKAK